MKPSVKSPESNSSSIQSLFREYHKSHINKTNQKIHYICVPAIFWSLTAMLWTVKIPGSFFNMSFNAALIALALLLLYYLLKSIKVFVVMVLFSALCLALNYWTEMQGFNLLWIAVIVFIIAWIGQFIGHHIEGEKPSFYKDLQFLLIGPAWVAFKFMGIKI